jgi:hypothetical protein
MRYSYFWLFGSIPQKSYFIFSGVGGTYLEDILGRK